MDVCGSGRGRLALALALSVVAATGLYSALRFRSEYAGGTAARVAVATVLALAVLACIRWLPATVSLRSPGRRLVVVLFADVVISGLVFLAFAGWLTPAAYAGAVGAAVVACIAVFWWFPQWQASRWPGPLETKDRVELEDKARGTVAQLLSGLGLIAAVAITLYSVNQGRVAANRTLRVTERADASSRFSRAIEQLGARAGTRPATEIRMGGIYSPQQYALETAVAGSKEDSAEARAATAAALTAYIRATSPRPELRESEGLPPIPQLCEGYELEPARVPGPVAPDVAAALDGLRRLFRADGVGDTNLQEGMEDAPASTFRTPTCAAPTSGRST
jgi:hypothetical protein